MKKISILFFLLFLNYSDSQIKNGSVLYGIVPIENGSGLDKLYLGLNDKFIERAKEFDFTLFFDSGRSFFDINKNFKNDPSQETSLAKTKISFFGEISQTKDSIFTNISSGFLGSNLIVKKEIEKDWVLSNETKMIDDFLCYKATTEIVRVAPNKTFRFPIIAWYCPKINLPFGPLGFGNLPGLILELQTKDAVFGIRKLVLNPVEEIEVPKLKKAKIISENELNNTIDNYNDSKKSE